MSGMQSIGGGFGRLRTGLLALAILAGMGSATARAADAVDGRNLALGKKVQFDPAPNYALCTDEGDAAQLTDGKLAPDADRMWSHKPATVGWIGPVYVTFTVDLGAIQPISGLGLHTCAGAAGVQWPGRIQALISDDGKSFHAMGELTADLPPSQKSGYQTRWFRANSLRTHGRYVKLLIRPGGVFFFSDEIEVYPGAKEWIGQALPGPGFADIDAFLIYEKSRGRIESDLKRVGEEISAASLDQGKKQALLDELARVRQRIDKEPGLVRPEGGKAILPLNELDRAVLGVWGRFLGESQAPPLTAWAGNPWDDLAWIGRPGAQGPATVRAMRHEVRPAAVNLTNATHEPMDVELAVEGLEEGAGLAGVDSVEWTDSGSGAPIAAALIRLKPREGRYAVRIPAGVTRQVWLTFRPTAAGQFSGRVVARGGKGQSAELPLRVEVFPLDFPAVPHLRLGGWDYSDENVRGMTDANRGAVIRVLQAYGVDTTWSRDTMPWGSYDGQGNMVQPPDMGAFDRWIQLWPNARKYAVFFEGIQPKMGDCAVGTAAFEKAVGQWARYIAKHARSKGIAPEKLMLLFVDEPATPAAYALSVAWGDAVRSSGAGFTLWTDPNAGDARTLPADFRRLFDHFTFNRYLTMKQLPQTLEVCRDLRREGKVVEVYGTNGPMKEQDPYAYVRLQAWLGWKMGAEASSFWSFTDNGGASDWMRYAARHKSFTPLFLDKTSATPTKHLAAMRAGVSDYEYLVMLREGVARGEKAGMDAALLERGRALLASAADRVLAGAGSSADMGELEWAHPKDRSVADKVRVEIGRWLVAASKGGKEGGQ